MKTMVRDIYGYSDVVGISTADISAPKENEILVKVHAVTVNRTDCAILSGKPFIMRFTTGLFSPREKTTGTDFAGEVVSRGEKAERFKAGDRVFGFDDRGLKSHAEYLIVKEDNTVDIIPETLSYREAAASLEGFHYAYNFVNKVELKLGDEVLVNGASGAIGSALVQICKYMGLEVTAVCSGKNKDVAEGIGADYIVDYKSEDFTRGEKKYDFVFDAVGKSSFGKCKSILKDGGTYISSELGYLGQNLLVSFTTKVFGSKKVVFPIPTNIGESIEYAMKLIKEGRYKPVIDRIYDLDEIAKAYDYVFSGHKVGNVVVSIVEDRRGTL